MVVDGKLWGELYATRHRGAAAFTEFDTTYVSVLAAILAGRSPVRCTLSPSSAVPCSTR